MINENKFNKSIVFLLPVISGVFWGCGGVFVRILNNFGLNSVTIFASRVCLATLILFLFLLIFDRDALKIKVKDLWLFVGSGLLGVMLLNLCYNEAAFTLTLSLASVLLSLAPIFAIIMSAILFSEKITFRKIFCIFLAIVGCVFVSGIFDSGLGFNLSVSGVFFGVLSAVFWALYGVFSKIATNKGYSTFTTIFYSFLLISLFLLIPSDWNLFASFLMVDPLGNGIFSLLHSLFTSVLPYVLFTLSLKFIENGRASILCSGAEPLSASVFGLLFFGESLTVLNIVGIVLTIIAISLLTVDN